MKATKLVPPPPVILSFVVVHGKQVKGPNVHYHIGDTFIITKTTRIASDDHYQSMIATWAGGFREFIHKWGTLWDTTFRALLLTCYNGSTRKIIGLWLTINLLLPSMIYLQTTLNFVYTLNVSLLESDYNRACFSV